MIIIQTEPNNAPGQHKRIRPSKLNANLHTHHVNYWTQPQIQDNFTMQDDTVPMDTTSTNTCMEIA